MSNTDSQKSVKCCRIHRIHSAICKTYLSKIGLGILTFNHYAHLYPNIKESA